MEWGEDEVPEGMDNDNFTTLSRLEKCIGVLALLFHPFLINNGGGGFLKK